MEHIFEGLMAREDLSGLLTPSAPLRTATRNAAIGNNVAALSMAAFIGGSFQTRTDSEFVRALQPDRLSLFIGEPLMEKDHFEDSLISSRRASSRSSLIIAEASSPSFPRSCIFQASESERESEASGRRGRVGFPARASCGISATRFA